jgi:predicted Zn-dependent protease
MSPSLSLFPFVALTHFGRCLADAVGRMVAVVALVGLALVGTNTVAAAQGLNLIRDTEIEKLLQDYARPVFKVANLPPVAIHIIQDDSINAFVTQGNNMFINTGLLLVSRNSNEVIGVMAHETGHIVGGHAVTFGDSVAAASTTSVLTTLLGLAAGVASKSPDVGMAVMLGGQGTAMRQLMAFSRDQESRADQFAIKALYESHQSPQGLRDFFARLAGQELLLAERQDPYVRTHPLTRERMDTVQAAVNTSPYTHNPPDPALELRHRRMVAKLFAFLKPQGTTLMKYGERDTSQEARYARSIAYFRRGQVDKALPLIDGLIAEFPKDPYFWELKGQMLLESGKMEGAVNAYRKSVEILPDAPLNQVSMAHAMVESGNKSYAGDAERALQTALAADPEDPFAWDLLARAYLLGGEPGMSNYAASERALLMGQYQDVIRYTKDAEKDLKKDTPTWYRLQDIRVTAQNELREVIERRKR